jgi:hypothetical protein
MTRRASDRPRTYHDAILSALYRSGPPLTATDFVHYMRWEEHTRLRPGAGEDRCVESPDRHSASGRLLARGCVTDHLQVRPVRFQLAGFLAALARESLVQRAVGTIDDRVVLYENTARRCALGAPVPVCAHSRTLAESPNVVTAGVAAR